MRRETEMLFEHVVRDDRSLLELIDCDYTFLNERLAKHYGIDGVKGDEMRRCRLAAGEPAGGVLTQGTVLAVTSNPDRTSPVKRGLFILDNILGSPPRAAAAEHPAARRRRQAIRQAQADPARDAGPAPAGMPSCTCVPRSHGPAWAGARKLQRAWALAREGARSADRRLGQADHRRGVQGHPRAEADPGQARHRAISIAA